MLKCELLVKIERDSGGSSSSSMSGEHSGVDSLYMSSAATSSKRRWPIHEFVLCGRVLLSPPGSLCSCALVHNRHIGEPRKCRKRQKTLEAREGPVDGCGCALVVAGGERPEEESRGRKRGGGEEVRTNGPAKALRNSQRRTRFYGSEGASASGC